MHDGWLQSFRLSTTQLYMPRHKRPNNTTHAATAALKKARSDSLPHVQRLFEENEKNVEEGSDGKDYNSNIFRRL